MTKRSTYFIFSIHLIMCLLALTSAEGKQSSSTTTNRESRQIFMLPQYSSSERDPSHLFNYHMNRPSLLIQSFPIQPYHNILQQTTPYYSLPLPASVGEGRTFAAFANLFRLPLRPTCLSPLPSSIISFDSSCPNPVTLVRCAKLTAAPSGVISVKFSATAGTAAVIGIAANSPNTVIQVTCSTIPTADKAITKIGDNPVTKGTTLLGDPNAYISVIMAGDGDSLNCVWSTIPA